MREYLKHCTDIQECSQALDVTIDLLRKVGETEEADKLAEINSKYSNAL